MKQATVYLFDIDGTLITSGGSARGALLQAFESFLGPQTRVEFSFGGMTDRAIIRQGLLESGHLADESRIDEILAAYLELLPEVLAAADGFRVHDGVLNALDALQALATTRPIALGLGTGNVERGARLKLERVDLNGYFAFGGFGCMSEQRPELLRLGAERGARSLGRELADCRVVVIGDTPKDISAARAIGAQVIAVATGAASLDELAACKADFLFENLSHSGVLEALIG
ncbi:MAG: haloacid dehalogenase-like hydrolase [Bradymonadaceae bacterium]|nr:haloacid dehalogenase-like hydrolase [Lujinxingiaceae bacterium]